jgi:hypothetical protein
MSNKENDYLSDSDNESLCELDTDNVAENGNVKEEIDEPSMDDISNEIGKMSKNDMMKMFQKLGGKNSNLFKNLNNMKNGKQSVAQKLKQKIQDKVVEQDNKIKKKKKRGKRGGRKHK